MGRGKGRRSIELIQASLEILREIQPATVRAVAYRLFTAGLIESMSKNETNRVSAQLTWAREQGQLDWAWIVDETRAVEVVSSWADPSQFADTVTRACRRNKWTAQPVRLEVWSEKGTVRGTLAPILNEYEVPFRVMHGYASATTVREIASLSHAIAQPIHALYVGDWDPSGLNMSEVDLPGRLREYYAQNITLSRIALVAEDVDEETNLPGFLAETKRGDSRYRWFVERYGEMCWELDALSPVHLRNRVEDEILDRLDRATWDRYVHAEAVERESIVAAVSAWRDLAADEMSAHGR
jgi:hypothetical protein